MKRLAIHKSIKEEVIARSQGKCAICNFPAVGSGGPYEIDHIKPVALGGSNFPDNLQIVHKSCHALKTQQQRPKINKARGLAAKFGTPEPLEADIQAQVLDYLASVPLIHFWRSQPSRPGRGYHRSETGQPDIMAVYLGIAVGLELKATTRQSEGQERFQIGFEAAGGRYYIIRSLDEVIQALAEIREESI